MQTITLKLELLKPTKEKIAIYRKMIEMNTAFSNWLLKYEPLKSATSKVFHLFSKEKFPSAIVNQTIREVKSKKKYQKTKQFRRFWCGFSRGSLKSNKFNIQSIGKNDYA